MIKLLRTLGVLFFFLLFGLGAFFVSFVLFPSGRVFTRGKESYRAYCTGTIHHCWRVLTELLVFFKIIELEIEDYEKLSSLRGKIIVSNHPSLIDIVILIGLIPKSICMAKKELMDNFLLRNILKGACIVNNTPVDEFKDSAAQALEAGFNIIIFPTGTREQEDSDLKIHKGAALLAISAQTPIVPLCIKCNYKFLARKQSILEAGSKPVRYSIDIMPEIKPLNTQDETPDILLRNRLSAKIKESIS